VSTLHVTNGDCAGDTLKQFADGPVIVTCDVLHEGPAPALDGDAWYATRGRFLGDDDASARRIATGLAAADRAVGDALARGDDVVLWFEHDLFDQLLLIRTLDLIGRLPVAPGVRRPVSLICIDRFPGVDRFIGLGQLDATQLQSLYPSRRPVTADQFAIASAAWDAFRSPDPRSLIEIAVRPPASARSATAGSRQGAGESHQSEGGAPDAIADTTGARDEGSAPLPFLRQALLRFLAEYPSASNGLTGTEQLALAALGEGPLAAGALFATTQAEEPRPFMGDTTFFDTLRAMAAARTPLVEIDAPSDRLDIRRDRVAITAAGQDVVEGRRDRVVLNGISMWRGGVHLEGRDTSPFRWDARRETLVS